MRPSLLEVLACPQDGHYPLEIAATHSGDHIEEGLLRCHQCGAVYAIIHGVPHLTAPSLREFDLERELVGRLRRGSVPSSWLHALESIWLAGESRQDEEDRRLIAEGRYWSEYYRLYARHDSWTLFDARHKGSHYPYLFLGIGAIDARDEWRVHDHWPASLARRILAFFDETIAAGAKRFLDFGCGGGQFSLEATWRGAQSVGFDLATGGLELGLQYARRNGLDAQYVRAEPNALPFRPSVFDAMVVKDALHHMDSPRAALREVSALLKPNAPLMVMDHIAEKPRWERFSWRMLQRALPRLQKIYPAVEPSKALWERSPQEMRSNERLENVLREELNITQWRGEMLFSDEWTLPLYLLSGQRKFPAEYLARVLYRLERMALLWGKPRFVFARGTTRNRIETKEKQGD